MQAASPAGLVMELLRDNGKTLRSFDVTTVCARARAGNPCPYCYVETARKHGFRPKSVVDYTPYDGWVMTLKQDTIDRLNAMGGCRMFSFADYEPSFRADCRRFLGDCCLRGLSAKTVTKVPLFVAHHHDNPAISVIHLSVDSLKKGGSQVRHETAIRMRERYRKVLVRAVCLSREDLEHFGTCGWVDILTLNHGQNGFHQFSQAERDEAARQYGGRLCCADKVCEKCSVRCGVDKICAEREAV